jgi:acetyl-CoA carboxylase carboxyl transferase subunit beta
MTLLDVGSYVSSDDELRTIDPLHFIDKKNYGDRLEKAYGLGPVKDTVWGGMGTILGQKISLAVMDFPFMGGSMGVCEMCLSEMRTGLLCPI